MNLLPTITNTEFLPTTVNSFPSKKQQKPPYPDFLHFSPHRFIFTNIFSIFEW
jgi:hypothetical protein